MQRRQVISQRERPPHARGLTVVIAVLALAASAPEARGQSDSVGAVATLPHVAKRSDSSAAVAAAPTAPAMPAWLVDIQPNLFVSFGYTYNFNRPADRVNRLRVFDADANTFDVDVAELNVQKAVAKPNDAGFRVDLQVGGAIPQKSQAAGLTIGTGADLKQAYVSFIAPVGSGLRLDFGKTVTWLGYEAIEGYDGFNDNYSRSLLFDYAIPFTHTGVKAAYAFNSVVSTMVSVTNGWDNVKDNNDGKSVGAQLALTPAAPLSILLNYIGGPEKVDTNGAMRHLFDAVATYKLGDALALGANVDYGVERGASLAVPSTDAVWKGAAAYTRYAFSDKLSLALRGETFHDNGGTRLGTGVATTASELTVTPSLRFTDHFLIRGDWRLDRANQPLFVARNGSTFSQRTVAVNAIFVY